MGAMARSSTEQAQAAALARAEAEVAALTQRLAAAEARTPDTAVRQRLDQVGGLTRVWGLTPRAADVWLVCGFCLCPCLSLP